MDEFSKSLSKSPNFLPDFISAFMARVIARETVPSATKSMEDPSKSESVKFTLQIKSIFRKSEDSVVNGAKRQNVSLYVFSRDLDCKCPKIKIKK